MSAMVVAPTVRMTVPAVRRASGARTARVRRAVATGGSGQLRLTRRGRVVVWLLGVALATGLGGVAASASADGPARGTEVRRVVVEPGQTLWGIAAEVAAPGEDVRDVVLGLMRLNRLPSGGLQAGQEIVVPVG